jgi:hypothetical protein
MDHNDKLKLHQSKIYKNYCAMFERPPDDEYPTHNDKGECVSYTLSWKAIKIEDGRFRDVQLFIIDDIDGRKIWNCQESSASKLRTFFNKLLSKIWAN